MLRKYFLVLSLFCLNSLNSEVTFKADDVETTMELLAMQEYLQANKQEAINIEKLLELGIEEVEKIKQNIYPQQKSFVSQYFSDISINGANNFFFDDPSAHKKGKIYIPHIKEEKFTVALQIVNEFEKHGLFFSKPVLDCALGYVHNFTTEQYARFILKTNRQLYLNKVIPEFFERVLFTSGKLKNKLSKSQYHQLWFKLLQFSFEKDLHCKAVTARMVEMDNRDIIKDFVVKTKDTGIASNINYTILDNYLKMTIYDSEQIHKIIAKVINKDVEFLADDEVSYELPEHTIAYNRNFIVTATKGEIPCFEGPCRMLNAKGEPVFGEEFEEVVLYPDRIYYTTKSMEKQLDLQDLPLNKLPNNTIVALLEDLKGEQYFVRYKSGKLVKVKTEKCIELVSENIIFFKEGELIGAMDLNMDILLAPKFSNVIGFSEGLCAFEVGDEDNGFRSGYIDKELNEIIKAQFFITNDFSNGLAIVSDLSHNYGSGTGIINKKGKFVVPPDYDEISSSENGFFSVKKHEGWGVIDKTGKVIVPIEYPVKVEWLDGCLAIHFACERIGLLDPDGKPVNMPVPAN